MGPAGVDPPALAGLRGIHLLAGLPDEVLAEVAQACRFRLYRARQAVISRADVDRDCYLIVSGRVRVVALSPAGREVSFRDAGSGEAIGEIAALDGRPRSATVVALQDTLLARLSPEALATLLRSHWPICERLLRHLAGAARGLTERVYELSTLGVQQRLCAELLRLALAVDAASTDRVVLSPAPSHSELAARISSYREQVTRELADLARQGLVSRDDRQLVIEDLRRLAERIDAVRAHA
jgi:CRP/FNR family transcriptional regulator, cyclic AMP receptor protein